MNEWSFPEPINFYFVFSCFIFNIYRILRFQCQFNVTIDIIDHSISQCFPWFATDTSATLRNVTAYSPPVRSNCLLIVKKMTRRACYGEGRVGTISQGLQVNHFMRSVLSRAKIARNITKYIIIDWTGDLIYLCLEISPFALCYIIHYDRAVNNQALNILTGIKNAAPKIMTRFKLQ